MVECLEVERLMPWLHLCRFARRAQCWEKPSRLSWSRTTISVRALLLLVAARAELASKTAVYGLWHRYATDHGRAKAQNPLAAEREGIRGLTS